MALSPSLKKTGPGAGPQHRNAVDENFAALDERVPPFDPVADEGKVLTIVDGVPAWTTPAA